MYKKSLLIIWAVMLGILTNITTAYAKEEPTSSDYPLHIETYRGGNNQLTHPSCISFDKEWNEYRYWMAYTPYPYANGEEENPSICASNDLYQWDTPKGLANPIANNEEVGCDELKDSHILYRDDLNRIEVWYLGRISENISYGKYDPSQLLLFRKYSYDGVHWSNYEVMSEVDYLCPSIIWKDGKYQLWQIGYDLYKTTGRIQYLESNDGFTWKNEKFCTIANDSKHIKIWHGSVNYNYDLKKYEMVYIDDGGKNDSILYCTSKDGIIFDKPKGILNISNQWNRFYRPYLLYENHTYSLFYGVITNNNEWYISMNRGKDTHLLKPLTSKDKTKMIDLDYSNLNVSMISKIKNIIHDTRNYIRFEIYVIPFLLIILRTLIKKYYNKDYIWYILNLLLSIMYVFILRNGINISNILALIFMIITSESLMFTMIGVTRNKAD